MSTPQILLFYTFETKKNTQKYTEISKTRKYYTNKIDISFLINYIFYILFSDSKKIGFREEEDTNEAS